MNENIILKLTVLFKSVYFEPLLFFKLSSTIVIFKYEIEYELFIVSIKCCLKLK